MAKQNDLEARTHTRVFYNKRGEVTRAEVHGDDGQWWGLGDRGRGDRRVTYVPQARVSAMVCVGRMSATEHVVRIGLNVVSVWPTAGQARSKAADLRAVLRAMGA